ncbi:hypothetical protein IQ254_29580 [Nodosilinea sp. LEGE 07088]|nr:hypothetical protein [Nodosilinea sp. LEGE 07088]MBE9141294.1 hypothetical protein [Nodosilinea sp. LEGE 07088]
MNDSQQALTQLAEIILQDPVLLDRLSDRIYNLLTTEIRLQQERNPRRF